MNTTLQMVTAVDTQICVDPSCLVVAPLSRGESLPLVLFVFPPPDEPKKHKKVSSGRDKTNLRIAMLAINRRD